MSPSSTSCSAPWPRARSDDPHPRAGVGVDPWVVLPPLAQTEGGRRPLSLPVSAPPISCPCPGRGHTPYQPTLSQALYQTPASPRMLGGRPSLLASLKVPSTSGGPLPALPTPAAHPCPPPPTPSMPLLDGSVPLRVSIIRPGIAMSTECLPSDPGASRSV